MMHVWENLLKCYMFEARVGESADETRPRAGRSRTGCVHGPGERGQGPSTLRRPDGLRTRPVHGQCTGQEAGARSG